MAMHRSLSRLGARTGQVPWAKPNGAFVPTYWMGRHNSCPACTRSNWWIGRLSAECGFCGATLPIASPAVHTIVPDQKAA